jgi:hypothetical protein
MTGMYSTNLIEKCKAANSSATLKLVSTTACHQATSDALTTGSYKPEPVAINDDFLFRKHSGWSRGSIARCAGEFEYSTGANASNTLVNLYKLCQAKQAAIRNVPYGG